MTEKKTEREGNRQNGRRKPTGTRESRQTPRKGLENLRTRSKALERNWRSSDQGAEGLTKTIKFKSKDQKHGSKETRKHGHGIKLLERDQRFYEQGPNRSKSARESEKKEQTTRKRLGNLTGS